MLVLGSEYAGGSAVFQPKGGRAELLSLPKADAEDFEGSPRKPTGRRIDDPATREAYMWLAKAIPHFATVLENCALTLERRAMNRRPHGSQPAAGTLPKERAAQARWPSGS